MGLASVGSLVDLQVTQLQKRFLAIIQEENRDGYATSGSYRVALPDGRIQTVTYTVADAYSGLVADVSYEGEAQYPEEKPSYAPKPTYAPYKPACEPHYPA